MADRDVVAFGRLHRQTNPHHLSGELVEAGGFHIKADDFGFVEGTNKLIKLLFAVDQNSLGGRQVAVARQVGGLFFQAVGQHFGKGAEFEVVEEGKDGLGVEVVRYARFQVEGDGGIGDNFGELVAKIGIVLAFGQLFAAGPFDSVYMGVDAVKGFVIVDELGGGFGANAFDTGDVVAGVANEGFPINYLVGADTEVVENGRFIKHLRRLAAPRGQLNRRVVIHQLQQVAVAGDDVGGHVLLFGLGGNGSQHVVSLVPLKLHNGDVECLHHLFDAVNLQP